MNALLALMRRWIYVLARCARGMAQSPQVQLVGVTTMSVCLLLLASVVLLLSNASRASATWGTDAPMTIYLQDQVAPDQVDALVEQLQTAPGVILAQPVSQEQALARLHEGLGSDQSVGDGLSAELMPLSIEVTFAQSASPNAAPALADRLQGNPLIDEIALAGPWAARMRAATASLRAVALGLAAIVVLACLMIVNSTIRLGVFARRAEIQILRLVGGTTRFVRAPFVMEGALQGALGAALALGVLYFAFDALSPWLNQGLSVLFVGDSLRFFSAQEIAIGIAFGAALGFAGARGAVQRFAEV